jgi:hypothetical protein
MAARQECFRSRKGRKTKRQKGRSLAARRKKAYPPLTPAQEDKKTSSVAAWLKAATAAAFDLSNSHETRKFSGPKKSKKTLFND